MKLSSFLKDKIWFITGQVLLAAFLSIALNLLNATTAFNLLICTAALLIAVGSLIIEYSIRKRYYNSVARTLVQMDKKQYISSVLPEPSFSDAKVLSDIIRQATKAMNDEIASFQIMSEEYRNYIETWIHEVKIPISVISLICENNKTDLTKSIVEENERIEAYVEQALFYARSTNIEKDYLIVPTSLEQVVKTAVKKHSKQLIAAKVQLAFDNLNVTVRTDAKWIVFILEQLISNSVKYRNETPIISFSVILQNGGTTLKIADNGIGIPPQDISRVFEKGFVGENGRRFAKSTGIGLYLCHQLCEKMGLGIKIKSEAGNGTTVFICFPHDKFLFLL